MQRFLLALWMVMPGCQSLFAQNYTGMLVDSISGEPVSYATVQYGEKAGVITNEEGFFQFKAQQGTPPDLLISCLGYEQKIVPANLLKPFGNVIRLHEAFVRLDEVFLSNEIPNGETIIEKVRANLEKNYGHNLKNHRIFSRETEYVDFDQMDFRVVKASGVSRKAVERTNLQLDSLARVIRNNRTLHFKDYLGNLYLKDENTAKLQVERATTLLDTRNDYSLENIQEKAQGIVLQYLDTTLSYKIKTGILKIEDSLKLNGEFRQSDKPAEYKTASLRTESRQLLNTAHFFKDSFMQGLLEPRAYSFRFEKAAFLNDELIYILEFQPRKGRSKYTGKLFVNGNDYAIVKMNYGFAEGKRGSKVNLKLLLGIKYVEDTEYGTILFNKGEASGYEPTYIQRTSGSYFYVNRPFKFIENSSDKDKVRFSFIVAGNNRNREELLITATETIDDPAFGRIEELEKVPVKELSLYDETLWQDEETLQPLEEMRQFNALK